MGDEKDFPENEHHEDENSSVIGKGRIPEGEWGNYGGETEPIKVDPRDLENDEEGSFEVPNTEQEIFDLLDNEGYTLDSEGFSENGMTYQLSEISSLIREDGKGDFPSDIWLFETHQDNPENWQRVDMLGNSKSLLADRQIKSGSKLQLGQLEYKVFVSPKDGSLIVGKK